MWTEASLFVVLAAVLNTLTCGLTVRISVDDAVKPGPENAADETREVAVHDFVKAVKRVADEKGQAFGPSDAILKARQVELQRQKVKLHQEGKL